jgi:hypothetical protein
MPILYFSDVLKKVGLDPKEVKLIRHSLSDEKARACNKAGMLFAYTQHQAQNFSNGYHYWVTFISDGGTYARLQSCYRVKGFVPDTPDVCPAGLPDCEVREYQGNNAVFDLEHVDLLREYEGKLVIDWGKAAISWHQKGTNEKPIVAIASKNCKPFVGFESLILSFDELKEVVENKADYELWHAAMEAVNAVYLVVDTKTGKQYVGSTYNTDGLLGRWAVYVSTGGHGNNKGLIEYLQSGAHSCHDLQFSVLQVLSKSLSADQICKAESTWKDKLLTREFGLNEN